MINGLSKIGIYIIIKIHRGPPKHLIVVAELECKNSQSYCGVS